MTGSRRHETTSGVPGVVEEAPDRIRLFGQHESEQALFLSLGQFRQQVCGVVRPHGLENVGGALALEGRQDFDLLFFGQLFEDVGQPLVVQSRGDLGPSLLRQIVHHARQVGRAQLVESREQVRGALSVLLKR